MLRTLKELEGYTIHATDGEIGKVHEFLFDDEQWTIRYLVVNTGNWLAERLVLITPKALGEPDWGSQSFPVSLTREQIKNSPDINANQPVSHQRELELHHYYGWPLYWAPGVGMAPVGIPTAASVVEKEEASEKPGDPHLRSSRQVMKYHVHARDGEIGHVEDFIVEDGNWIIRYMVVDTRNWWPGKKVLVAPGWVDRISWVEAMVYVDLMRQRIEEGPEFDPSVPVNWQYEEKLYDYYGRPKYWA